MKHVFDVVLDRLELVNRATWIKFCSLVFIIYLSGYFIFGATAADQKYPKLVISKLATELRLQEDGYLEVADTIKINSDRNSHGIIRKYNSKILEPKLFRYGIDFIFTPEVIEGSPFYGVRVGSNDLALNDGETEFTLTFRTKPTLEITPTKETLTWNFTNKTSTEVQSGWVRLRFPRYLTKDSLVVDAVSKVKEVNLFKASTFGEPVREIEDRDIASISWEDDSTLLVMTTRRLMPHEDIQITVKAAPLTFKVISDS